MRILQRKAKIHIQGDHIWWESCSGKVKSTFKELTFNENPAAGSSNPYSKNALLMRILQREAQIHVQRTHFRWESCSGKLKSTFKELTFEENPAAGSSNPRSMNSLLIGILQREAQMRIQEDNFWWESCSGKLKSTFKKLLLMWILQQEAQNHVKKLAFNENPAAGSSNPRSTNSLLMRILQREAQMQFKELTFEENPAAGSSNLRSMNSLLMRILQREAQMRVQEDNFWWESCSGKLKSTFKKLLLMRILQQEAQKADF